MTMHACLFACGRVWMQQQQQQPHPQPPPVPLQACAPQRPAPSTVHGNASHGRSRRRRGADDDAVVVESAAGTSNRPLSPSYKPYGPHGLRAPHLRRHLPVVDGPVQHHRARLLQVQVHLQYMQYRPGLYRVEYSTVVQLGKAEEERSPNTKRQKACDGCVRAGRASTAWRRHQSAQVQRTNPACMPCDGRACATQQRTRCATQQTRWAASPPAVGSAPRWAALQAARPTGPPHAQRQQPGPGCTHVVGVADPLGPRVQAGIVKPAA